MAKETPVYKHVFLEYSEYQRFLELKRRNEELVEKNRQLEKKIAELEDQKGHGLSELIEKENREKLKRPLVGLSSSITLPPSAKGQKEEYDEYDDTKPWYFLGKP